MEIIKRGTPPGDRVWRGTCRSCGTEATAKQIELKDIQHDQRENSYFCWMACPVCMKGPYGGILFHPEGTGHE